MQSIKADHAKTINWNTKPIQKCIKNSYLTRWLFKSLNAITQQKYHNKTSNFIACCYIKIQIFEFDNSKKCHSQNFIQYFLLYFKFYSHQENVSKPQNVISSSKQCLPYFFHHQKPLFIESDIILLQQRQQKKQKTIPDWNHTPFSKTCQTGSIWDIQILEHFPTNLYLFSKTDTQFIILAKRSGKNPFICLAKRLFFLPIEVNDVFAFHSISNVRFLTLHSFIQSRFTMFGKNDLILICQRTNIEITRIIHCRDVLSFSANLSRKTFWSLEKKYFTFDNKHTRFQISPFIYFEFFEDIERLSSK